MDKNGKSAGIIRYCVAAFIFFMVSDLDTLSSVVVVSPYIAFTTPQLPHAMAWHGPLVHHPIIAGPKPQENCTVKGVHKHETITKHYQ